MLRCPTKATRRRDWCREPFWLILVAATLILLPNLWDGAQAAPTESGYATSSVLSCLPVGAGYLGSTRLPTPYVVEKTVTLDWDGSPTSAELVAYEFNANDAWGHDIYINGHKIGTATGTRNDETLCRGFVGREPLTWSFNPAILVKGQNTIRITVESTLADQSWGLSRAYIRVTGATVDGPRFEQITIPSSYYFDWQGYQDEGTWTDIRLPRGYDGSEPTPLVILAHGYGSDPIEPLLDLAVAAENRGWLLASPYLHGEVNNGFYGIDSDGVPRLTIGNQVVGSRASQYDILAVADYVQAHYNVDVSRVYLVGHSMGGQTALVTAAKWPQRFAAVVSDSGPTDLTEWEYDTRISDPVGITPNFNLNWAIRSETGAFRADTHEVMVRRQPSMYEFEYARRSPQEYAANFRHLPVLLQHAQSDTKVHRHFAEDMYLRVTGAGAENASLSWFPGDHGAPLANRAEGILDWLAAFQRQEGFAPQNNSFALDESGRVFWVGVQLSSDAVSVEPTSFALRTEAHFVRVHDATYDNISGHISLDVENQQPETGDPASFGAFPPANLNTELLIYLDQIGLPRSGPYTVERMGRDTGAFSVTTVTAQSGVLRVVVPRGAYLYRLVAGDRPPTYQVLTLQRGANGYNGSQDTTLSAWSPSANEGYSSLHIHHDGSYPTIKPILRYDLGALPANAVVRFAVLGVQVTDKPNNINRMPTGAFKMNRQWAEYEASWEKPRIGTSWSLPGAEGAPEDRDADPVDERILYARWGNVRYGFDLTELVRDWQAAPSSNYGVMLRAAPESSQQTQKSNSFWLASSEYYLVSARPSLTIVYTLEQPTPIPTATPTSTATATPTATPTHTSTPTPTVTPTSTPASGHIDGAVFRDEDRDGVFDGDEVGLSGLFVWLRQGQVTVGQTFTGQDGVYTFANVPIGSWEVAAYVPAGYEITTSQGNPVGVEVSGGAQVVVLFGMAPIPTATPTATSTPSPTPTSTATSTPMPHQYLPLIVQAH